MHNTHFELRPFSIITDEIKVLSVSSNGRKG